MYSPLFEDGFIVGKYEKVHETADFVLVRIFKNDHVLQTKQDSVNMELQKEKEPPPPGQRPMGRCFVCGKALLITDGKPNLRKNCCSNVECKRERDRLGQQLLRDRDKARASTEACKRKNNMKNNVIVDLSDTSESENEKNLNEAKEFSQITSKSKRLRTNKKIAQETAEYIGDTSESCDEKHVEEASTTLKKGVVSEEEVQQEVARLEQSKVDTYMDIVQVRAKLLIDNSIDQRDVFLINRNPLTFLLSQGDKSGFVLAEDGRLLPKKMDAVLFCYTCEGILIRSDAINNASYLVHVTSGSVINYAPHRQYIACYEDEETQETKFAPGRIVSVPKQNCNDILVTYHWLPNAKEFNPDTDDLRDGEISSLPFGALMCDAEFIPWPVKAELLGDAYRTSLAAWERREQKKPLTFNDFILYHFLAFYHARDKWIWRTHVGQYIYQDFIVPFKNFGQQADTHNFKLINDVVGNVAHFTPNVIFPMNGKCEACCLSRILTQECIGQVSKHTYKIGVDCMERLIYLSNILNLVRTYRSLPYFDFIRMKALNIGLTECRTRYQTIARSFNSVDSAF